VSFVGDTGGGGTAFGPLKWVATGHPAAAGTYYLLPVDGAPDAGEYVLLAAGPGTYTELRVVASVALSTDSVTFTIRKNSVDTGLVAVLAAGQTSVTASGSIAVVAGDRISLKVVQSGTESTTTRVGAGVY
jgi:hypothetical protein